VVVDVGKLTEKEKERYFLLLQTAIQFNWVGFMSKEGMPKAKFLRLLAVEQNNLRLLDPSFPDFHFPYIVDTFQRILYTVNKKLVYQDWITTRLFSLVFDTYTSAVPLPG
jgi:hypothetical protein